MLFRKRLKGLRVAALATDGFEQVEVTIPMKALRAEGADVEALSLRRGKIRRLNLHWPGRTVPVDRLAAFTRAMLELFAERGSAAPRGAASHAISAPQRSAPPAWAAAGMVALSRAHTARRLLCAAAVLGAGIRARRRLTTRA